MKKRSVWCLVVLPLAIVSCNKDDDNAKAIESGSVVGMWQYTTAEAVSGSDTTVILTEIITGCSAENRFEMAADQTFHFVFYENDASDEDQDCIIRQETTGTYSYDAGTKIIAFSRNGTVVESWRLQSVTADRLRIIENDDRDYNNDGILDKEISVLARVP
ncbi:lipocalin-like protein [Flavobacterium endophyticum]|uniref:Lipocalin-like protein n=1 Tax=Flavobacterium endophyticum TaxID=1540163 RepID=A0A495MKW1_9FLAO|nr:lipocalin family protein [Flavobacterium endophyticum]RKS26058.1 lipocalin-like protein [Flavobacterium endophyticum]